MAVILDWLRRTVWKHRARQKRGGHGVKGRVFFGDLGVLGVELQRRERLGGPCSARREAESWTVVRTFAEREVPAEERQPGRRRPWAACRLDENRRAVAVRG